jgi:hypothetical protein
MRGAPGALGPRPRETVRKVQLRDGKYHAWKGEFVQVGDRERESA